MVAAVRQTIHRVAASSLFGRLVGVAEHLPDRSVNLLRVLTYHRVDETQTRPDLYPGIISATPETFAQQMEHIARAYVPLSMHQLLEAVRSKDPLPPRSILITFDDAYRDFATNAWPVLQSLNLPVTMFVATAFPGDPDRQFWWDRLYGSLCGSSDVLQFDAPWGPVVAESTADRLQVFKRMKEHVKTLPHDEAMALVESTSRAAGGEEQGDNHVLNWEELNALAEAGVTLAPHTRNHPLMNRILPAQARQEAVDSLNDLRERISAGIPPVLAYPAGGVDDETVRSLKDSPIELAFTTQRGINDLATDDILRLRRINVAQRTSLNLLRAQLLRQTRLVSGRLIG